MDKIYQFLGKAIPLCLNVHVNERNISQFQTQLYI